jgi:hypothetical protein
VLTVPEERHFCDRIAHHAEVLTLKGASYRLKSSGIDTLPPTRAENMAN